ncbi:MAG: lycopene cyclase domain-containing protein [Salibacteraceae bacterium]
MSLYLIINLASLSVPFLVSFHPRIKLYKYFFQLFSAIFITLIPFIVWDIWFTKAGYWGFNESYLMGTALLGLPIEEWLFFITIPYACVFTHISMSRLFPKVNVSRNWVSNITYALLAMFVLVLILHTDKWYTLLDMIMGIVVLMLTYIFSRKILSKFYLTFLVVLIPFFIVNGLLTGTGIENEIVWYNNSENLGVRMGTIPVEDSVYAFSLILLNLFLFDKFTKGNLISPL